MNTRSRAAKIMTMVAVQNDTIINCEYYEKHNNSAENCSLNSICTQHQPLGESFAVLQNVPLPKLDKTSTTYNNGDDSKNLDFNGSKGSDCHKSEYEIKNKINNQDITRKISQLDLNKLKLETNRLVQQRDRENASTEICKVGSLNDVNSHEESILFDVIPPNKIYTTVENVVIEDIENFESNNELKTCNQSDDNVSIFNCSTDGSEYFPSDKDYCEGLDEEEQILKPKQKKKKCKENNSGAMMNQSNYKDHMSEEMHLKNQSIIIRETSKNCLGKRNRDKYHNCYFCNKIYKELSKHFQNKHANEAEVAKVLAIPKNTEQRRKGFLRLSRVGDYYHNCEVLKRRDGELILLRMPTPEEKVRYVVSDYGPCPDCLGFLLKRHIWHHIKYSCTEKQDSEKNLRRQLVSESTALLSHTFSDIQVSTEFNKSIISSLKNDKISLACMQDNLIVKLAAMLFEKYHNTQNELIRQSMRQLGRMLLELRNIDPKKHSLSSWLKPVFFDNIIAAVKRICQIQHCTKSRPQFSIPSLALKLGYNLKKCIAIQKGVFLRNEDLQGVETLKSLLSLMDLEWCFKVSSSALATLNQRKMNVTELLPLTDDLVTLNTFLNMKLKEAKELLVGSINFKTWSNLASLTLCKILLFNKRRSGESSKMTVIQYSSRPTWSQSCSKEFQNTFSDLEMQLAARLTIVQIRGKRNRTVNVLLTPDIKEAIDLLLVYRGQFISSENPYLFARSRPSTEYIRGHDCLRTFSFEANLTRPELINGTKLRKYIATVCQIFNLTENETDWLARHLGHDIRVHREFYRMHESSVELTKISRILLAVERGEANKFHGKKLSEINICDLPEMELELDEHGYEDGDIEQNQEGEQKPKPTAKSKKIFSNKKYIRRPWKREETEAVLIYFRNYVKRFKVAPGKDLCTKCIKANKILSSRTWKDVKYYVYNYIKKVNKT